MFPILIALVVFVLAGIAGTALLRKLPRQPREEAAAPIGTPHQELLKRLELLK